MKFNPKENNKINLSEVTVIVNSCDAYSDVVEIFKLALREYWPDNPFKVVINYESNKILNYTKKEKLTKTWGERLINILEKINTPFIILLFDDFILEEIVDTNKIYSVINLLKKDVESSVFYLNAACVKDHDDDMINDYRLLKDNVNYRLNSVPSVWKTEELVRYTEKIDNPWSWEVFGSYRTFNNKRNFYSSSSQTKNIFKFNYNKGGAIYRGKWVKEVVESKVLKYKLNINLQDRGFVNLDEQFKRSFRWKVDFILLGFRSIGLKMMIYLYRSFKQKYIDS
tara:strand:+ start:8610 stop:9458 length:849 start_codon:yes stop_codon:yes gene_type:complete